MFGKFDDFYYRLFISTKWTMNFLQQISKYTSVGSVAKATFTVDFRIIFNIFFVFYQYKYRSLFI